MRMLQDFARRAKPFIRCARLRFAYDVVLSFL